MQKTCLKLQTPRLLRCFRSTTTPGYVVLDEGILQQEELVAQLQHRPVLEEMVSEKNRTMLCEVREMKPSITSKLIYTYISIIINTRDIYNILQSMSISIQCYTYLQL